MILLWKNFDNLKHAKRTLNEGGVLALTSVMSIAFMTGFGSVIRATPAFATLLETLPKLPGNPLVIAVLSTAIVCGFTGSASGGLSLVLPLIAPIFAGLVAPAALHRSVAIASSSLDTLPFNGGFLMFLGLADLNHKEAYPAVCVTTVIVTSLATILAVILFILFPSLAV
jgi:H+/gluconate symporter-like permease